MNSSTAVPAPVYDALEDVIARRVDRTAATVLDPATSLPDAFEITRHFMADWEARGYGESQARLVAVMRGAQAERRHPAFRVQPTELTNLYQADVTPDLRLFFHHDATRVTWLRLLPA